MSTHSKIGASGMYRWAKCPGSVKLCDGVEQRPSVYAEEGTHAHEIAAAILTGDVWTNENIPQEMLDAIEVYTKVIRQDHTGPCEILVEHKFDLSILHPGLFGTADCVIFYPNKKLLRVYDYKHGKGMAVEVANNPQLLYYALGALLSKRYRATTIELIVVQPRCPHKDGPVRRWSIPAFDLINFAADLKEAAMATEKENAPLVAGEHCKFCPASNGKCPVIYSRKLEKAKKEFLPIEDEVLFI